MRSMFYRLHPNSQDMLVMPCEEYMLALRGSCADAREAFGEALLVLVGGVLEESVHRAYVRTETSPRC